MERKGNGAHLFIDHFSGRITPFLGLRARLTQAALSPLLLTLVVYIVKLQILKKAILEGVVLARNLAVISCKTAQSVAEATLEAPREAALLGNRLISSSVEHSVKEMMGALVTTVTLVQNLILFVLEMTVGTYACLTISLVDIAASEAINATESVISFANNTIQNATVDIQEGLGKLTNLINGAEGLIEDVTEFVTGGSTDLKKVNLTVSALQNVSIPSAIDAKLDYVRSNIPTYDDTLNAVEDVINKPFQAIRASMTSINVSKNAEFNVVEVPAISSTNLTVCNMPRLHRDFDELKSTVALTADLLCGLSGLCILVAIGYSCHRTLRQWRRMEQAAVRGTYDEGHQGKENPFKDDAATENMCVITQATTSAIEIKLLHLITKNIRRDHHREAWHWYVRFLCHRPLLYVLGLGVAGMSVSILELIVYHAFAKGASIVGHDMATAEHNMTATIERELTQWRSATNANIASVEYDVNHNILGWVETGTQTVNTSLVTFMSKVNDEIRSVFNDTVMERPLLAVVDCLLGRKVQRVEEGLTWIHNRAQVSLPRVPLDFITSNKTSNSTAPSFTANSSAASKATSMALKNIQTTVLNQIKVQAIVSGILLAVWILFAIGALYYVSCCISSRKSQTLAVDKAEKAGHLDRRNLPPKLNIVPSPSQGKSSKVPVPALSSPATKAWERMSRIFSGPSRQPQMSHTDIQPVRHVQYCVPDSPKTPLRAAMF